MTEIKISKVDIKADRIPKKIIQQIKKWSTKTTWDNFKEKGVESFYVAFEEEKPIGYITLDDENDVIDFEVHPQQEYKIVGRQLVVESLCEGFSFKSIEKGRAFRKALAP